MNPNTINFERGADVVKDAYPFILRLDSQSRFLLWVDGGKQSDYFLSDKEGVPISFVSMARLKSNVARRRSLKVHYEDFAVFDINCFWRKLRSVRAGRGSSVDTCNVLLDGWNHLDDLLRNFEASDGAKPVAGKIVERAYEKLLFGCQLPSLTPPEKSYVPIWTPKEAVELRRYLKQRWGTFLSKAPTFEAFQTGAGAAVR
jgi:hypothetical protein